MTYSIGKMAERLNIPASTLRYYDKEGLLPFIERNESGVRIFKDSDCEALKIIECLKKPVCRLKTSKSLFLWQCGVTKQ